jgi:hypothetical protein
MSANQSSVMVALSELQRIESDRIASERAAEIERRLEESERLKKEQEERAEVERHRLRVAEAEARLRVAEEVRAAEAVQRAHRIEDELRVVKAEKAVLAEHLFATPTDAPMPVGYKFWRAVSAAMLVAVTAAGVALFAWPHRPPPPPVIVAARQLLPPVDDAASRQRIDELEKRVRSLMTKDPPSAVAHAPVRHKPTPGPSPKPVNLSAAAVDACDDPLCFMNPKK